MAKQRKIDKEIIIEENDYFIKYKLNLFNLTLNGDEKNRKRINENDTNFTSTSSSSSSSSSSTTTCINNLPTFSNSDKIYSKEEKSSSTSLASFSTYQTSNQFLHTVNPTSRNEKPLKDIGLCNLSNRELNLFYIYACKLCGRISTEPLNQTTPSNNYDGYYRKLYDDLFKDKQSILNIFMSKTKKEILNEMKSELSDLLLAITQVYYFD